MLAESSDPLCRIRLDDLPESVQLFLVGAKLFGAVYTAQIFICLFREPLRVSEIYDFPPEKQRD